MCQVHSDQDDRYTQVVSCCGSNRLVGGVRGNGDDHEGERQVEESPYDQQAGS